VRWLDTAFILVYGSVFQNTFSRKDMKTWPHAPAHRLSEKGTYMVTCGTYLKRHHLNEPARLNLVQELFFDLAERYGWQLQAWAFLSNHYHFVAHSPDDPETLRVFLSTLHTLTARDLNRMDKVPGRRVWYEFYDSRITYHRSYLARLKYVHYNPVHHGIVTNATDYSWCSARWFESSAGLAFRRTLESFKTDRISVLDDYETGRFPGSER